MKCDDLDELLSAYIDSELVPEQKTLIENHLAECTDCRAKANSYRMAGEQLSSGIKSPSMPDIKESTMQKITSRKQVFRTRSTFIAVPVGLILILLLVLQPWSFGPISQTVIARASNALNNIQSYDCNKIAIHNL